MAQRIRETFEQWCRSHFAYFAPARPPVTEHIPRTSEFVEHRRGAFKNSEPPAAIGAGWRVLKRGVAPRRDYVYLERLCRRLEGKRKGGQLIAESRNPRIAFFAR